MKKSAITFTMFFLLCGAAFAQSDCDVWLGTWDVVKEDGTTCVWVIDEIITGTSSNIPCQAMGTSTPSDGGAPTSFQIIQVVFYPNFVYTESKKLGEEQESHELLINTAGDAFDSGTVFTDYDLVSGVKRLSGPRCGGIEPSFVSAGDTEVVVTIRGTETSFDSASTEVVVACPEIELLSADVISATEIMAVISVSEDVVDTNCSVSVTTGGEEIACSIEVRGVGDPERVAWQFYTGGIVSSSVTIDGDYAYYGGGDKKVYCLDAKTGGIIWEYETGNVVISSPAVTGGYVYVGSNDFNVYCLDAATGSKVWEYATGEAVQSSPAVADGYVYVGSYDDKIYCLDAATGSKVWDYSTTEDVFSTPAVVDGRVYFGGVDYFLYCLDAKTGALIWQYETEGDIPPSPAVAGGKVFFGSKDHSFYCLDAETGQKLWDFYTGDINFTSPAVYEDFVFFGSLNKYVYCLNTEDGSLAWQFQTGDVVQSSPAVTDDYVYFGSGDKNVYCLDFRTGIKQWNFKTGDSVIASPSVSDGLVYVGSYDGTLYCLHAPDGETESWPMFRNNIRRTGTPESACLTAQLLGGDDERLQTLRRFRDTVLAGNAVGEKLISMYYAYDGRVLDLCRKYPLAEKATVTLIEAVMPVVSLAVQ